MLYRDFKKFTLLLLSFNSSLTASYVESFDNQTVSSVKRTHEDVFLDPVINQVCYQNDCTIEEAVQSKVLAEATECQSYDLPPELLQEIFLYLDTSELKSCRLVSQLFAALVLDIQSRSVPSLVLKLSTMSDFTDYLSHNRQYSLRSININFTFGDNTALVDRDLSHIIFLCSDYIKNTGVMTLAQGNLTNLTELDLQSNQVGDTGVIALAQGNLTNLKKLYLDCNNIGDTGALALAQGNLTNLTELDLQNNKIDDAGTIAMAQGHLINLTSLNMKSKKIGEVGTKALAQGNLTRLTTLNLDRNKIGEAAQYLLQTKIENLYF